MLDLEAARKAGYGDDVIARALAEEQGVDFDAALTAGYSPSDMLPSLMEGAKGKGFFAKAGDFISDALTPETGVADKAEAYSAQAQERAAPGNLAPLSEAGYNKIASGAVVPEGDGVIERATKAVQVDTEKQAEQQAVGDIFRDAEDEKKAEEAMYDDFKLKNPNIAAYQSGTASLASSLLDVPQLSNDLIKQVAIDPFRHLFGKESLPPIARFQIAKDFEQAGKDYMPEIAKKSLSELNGYKEVGSWIAAQASMQSPQIVASTGAALIPKLRAAYLSLMGLSSGASNYQDNLEKGVNQNTAMNGALVNASAEIIGESLGFGAFDYVGKYIKNLPLPQRGAVVADALKKTMLVLGAGVAQQASEGIGEGVTQIGQNASERYVIGDKSVGLMDRVPEAVAIGAIMGTPTAIAQSYRSANPSDILDKSKTVSESIDTATSIVDDALNIHSDQTSGIINAQTLPVPTQDTTLTPVTTPEEVQSGSTITPAAGTVDSRSLAGERNKYSGIDVTAILGDGLVDEQTGRGNTQDAVANAGQNQPVSDGGDAAVAFNGESAVDRRTTADERRAERYAAMSPEELQVELKEKDRRILSDHLTGIPNRAAYDEAIADAKTSGKQPLHIFVDNDNQKQINAEYGMEGGDEAIRATARAMHQVNPKSYRLGGDEFIQLVDSQEEADNNMAKVREITDQAIITYTLPDGTVRTKKGIGISYGTGTDIKSADASGKKNKADRAAQGLRYERELADKMVADNAKGRETENQTAGREVKPAEVGVTSAEVAAIQDVPTTEKMSRAIAAVGENKFQAQAEAKIAKYRPSNEDQKAMLVEATAIEILAKENRATDPATAPQAPRTDTAGIRQHVETLTKRRNVISQIPGISSKEYGIAIEKAKLAMQSGRGKAGDFNKLAKRFAGKDAQIHAALTSIANLLEGPAVKKVQKPSTDLIQRIKQLGGINKDYAEDFGAKDAKFNIKSAFKQGGESPDFIAQQLKDEGYPLSEADLIGSLSEHVKRYINGERSFKHVDVEASGMSEYDDRAFQEMMPDAEKYGIDWKQFKNPDDLYIAITRAEDAKNDAEEAALDVVLGDPDITLDDVQQSNEAEVNAWLSGENNARGHTESTAGAAARESTESNQDGTQGAGSAQGAEFTLTGQTNAEIAAKEARAEDTTAEDKAAADRASAVPLTLATQSQEKTTGKTQQAGMFTPDGRATVAAQAKPADETSTEDVVIKQPYGVNTLVGLPEFDNAKESAAHSSKNTIVRVSINKEGLYERDPVKTLFGAFVANGDGTATWAQATFPASKERPSDAQIMDMAESIRLRDKETKAKIDDQSKKNKAALKEKGIVVGTELQSPETYVPGKKGITTFSKAKVVAIDDHGIAEIHATLKGSGKTYIFKADASSRLFDKLESTPASSKSKKAQDAHYEIVDAIKVIESRAKIGASTNINIREANAIASDAKVKGWITESELQNYYTAIIKSAANPSAIGPEDLLSGEKDNKSKKLEVLKAQAQGSITGDQGAALKELADAGEHAAVDAVLKPENKSESAPIQDFGEKISGAKKEYAAAYKDRMAEAKTMDVLAQPLSKSWPEPDYQKLIEAGSSPRVVGLVRSMRDEIPNKPGKSYKQKTWAAQVELLRDTADKMLNDKEFADKYQAEFKKTEHLRLDDAINGRAELYELLGHEKSLKGIHISRSQYSVYDGVPYNPPKVIWEVVREAKATAFGNMPRTLGSGDTRQAAIDSFQKAYSTIDTAAKDTKTKFEIYADRYAKAGDKGQYYIGKKVGRNVIKIKTGMDSVKEARTYITEHNEELAAILEKKKEVPNERYDINQPRVGQDMRNAQDVTPEMFSEAFGFRGVQFGNYVEGKRRQQDLNDAYDALMDLSAVLDIPPKAISLNGELGLAFGARGSGGIHSAAAHYERGQVVINLTKGNGAGSLAHEWFHSLDNYFSRIGGKKDEYITDSRDVKSAARDAGYPIESKGIRKEMIDAFGAVVKSINQTAIKQRSASLDGRRAKKYWGTGIEMAARSFERYVIAKLQDSGFSNDYLANVVSEEYWNAAEELGVGEGGSYPYPTVSELPAIRAGFDHLFQTIESKETDKGIALFNTKDEADGSPTIDSRADEVHHATHEEFETLRKAVEAATKVPIGLSQRPRNAPLRDGSALNELARAFGKKVVGYEATSGILTKQNGIVLPKALPQYIFINKNTDRPHMAVLGHELVHHMSKNNPELYLKFVNAIRPYIQENYPDFAKKFKGMDNAAIREEFLGEVVSDGFMQPAFWEVLGKRNPSLLKRVGEMVREMFQRAIRAMGYTNKTEKYISDFDSVMRIAGDVMGEYGINQADVFGDASLTDEAKFMTAKFSRQSSIENAPPSKPPRSHIIGDAGRKYTPEQRAAMERTGSVVTHKTIKDTLRTMRQDVGRKMAQGLFDQFRPVRDISDHAYTLMRLSKGATGAFEAFIKHGKLSIRDGAFDADTTGGVLQKVFIPIGKESTDFLRWVAGNRAERLSSLGKENLFTPDDITAFKSLADGQTDFDYTLSNGTVTRDRPQIYADSLKKFNEFNKNIMDMAEQSGLIDGASRSLWEQEFYVPFYRVSNDEDGGVRGMNIKSGVVRQQAFKKLKGGEQQLNDLLENTLMNWAHLIDASAKNRAAKATLEAAANVGAARLAETGEKKTVWYMDNGKKAEYIVEDPHLMEAIGSLEYAGLRSPVMDALSTTKHVLTVGVTASPFFKVRNLIRDSGQAIATASNSDLSYNPFANIKKGFGLTDRSKQEYVSALAGGGLIRFGTMLEGSEAKRTRQLIRQGAKDTHILDNENKVRAFYDKFVEPSISAYNELGNRGEEINRMALYDALINKGTDHATASLMARDLMDFSMQGTWTSVRFLTQTVPFMNARLQGLYKLGRASQEDKARFAIVLGAVTVASLALLAAYGDDDDWKKREDWDRDNYWWFKFGGEAFRIPKPFEIGAIAMLAERSAELMFDDEMNGKRFTKAIVNLTANQLAMNPIPQALKPIIDIYANNDSFTGRSIESMGMENLEPSYRFKQNTSMVARGISTAGNAVTGNNFLSPVQIDHVVRAYFGWLGAFSVGSADMMIRAGLDEPTKPALDYWKTATGGMVSSLDGAQSRYVSQMYNQAKELEQTYATFRRLVKEGKTKEATKYREEHIDELSKYKRVERVKDVSSRINERIRLIERSNLDSEEKRRKINDLRTKQDHVARQLVAN